MGTRGETLVPLPKLDDQKKNNNFGHQNAAYKWGKPLVNA